MMKNLHYHFSQVAREYSNLRTTDADPVIFIKGSLKTLPKIEAADVGSGSGRYDLEFFRNMGERLHLYCIDNNQKMLEQLREYLTRHRISNFETMTARADDLPLRDGSMDCVFAFNAVHHFRLRGFLSEASRVLKNRGFLFIYTRLSSQNSRNIWGKFFPLFSQKETRLYELAELRSMLTTVPALRIRSIEFFSYKRVSNLGRLVEQAMNYHYSTFCLYTKEEFERSLGKFKQNLTKQFKDLNNVSWVDENVLLVVTNEVA